jgi:3-methyl-2-oxobutanoate hydroxymethyltransferase
MKTIRLHQLIEKKKSGQQISMLTAYDVMTSEIVSEAGIDIILVGDSLGNVFCGHDTTLPVTLDDIIYHTKAVVRGNSNSFIVADMPFLSYQISTEHAKESAGRLIKEGGAHGVKLEVGFQQLDTVKAILGMGVPVMAHLGFTPQSVHQLGGYRIQGRNDAQVQSMIELATALDQMGCFSVLLELVPSTVSQKITEIITIPTIGIGAGPHCNGQVLVTQDLWGMSQKTPRFVKKYAGLRKEMSNAVSSYIKDLETAQFPTQDHCYDP